MLNRSQRRQPRRLLVLRYLGLLIVFVHQGVEQLQVVIVAVVGDGAISVFCLEADVLAKRYGDGGGDASVDVLHVLVNKAGAMAGNIVTHTLRCGHGLYAATATTALLANDGEPLVLGQCRKQVAARETG